MKTLKAPLFAALAGSLIAAAAMAAPAHAEEKADTISFTYELNRAALTDARSARAVYWDIVKDANGACLRHGVPLRDLGAIDRDCVARIVDGVVAEAGSTLLAARHDGSRFARLARRSDDERTVQISLR